MKKLLIKLLRDIKQSIGQFIAVTLVIAIGITFFTGLTITYKSLRNSIDKFYEVHNLSDLWVYYQAIDDNGLVEIKTIAGVKNAEGRLRLEATLSSGKTGEFTVHTLAAAPKINVPDLISGTLPENRKECIIDSGYARANNIKPGDSISVSINNRDYMLKISGIYISPEYIYLVKSIEQLLPDHEKFGVLYLNHDFISELSGANSYNEVIVDLKDGAEAERILKKIENKTSGYGFGYGFGRDHLISHVMLESDINQLDKMGLFFPNIFFLVAAVILFISLSRRVELERNQIGIMKALGIADSSILLHFLGFALLTGITGSVIGSLAGVLLLPQGLYSSYAMAYTLPVIHPSGFIGQVIIAAVLSLSFGIIATVFSCRKALNEIPAQAMRPKMPKKIKEIIFEKNEWLWNKFSYNKKLMLRNIFVNKRRGILSSIGIIGCVGLIIASLAMKDSMDDILKRQFKYINKYDIGAVLKTPVKSYEEVKFYIANIKNICKNSKLSVSFEPEGKEMVNTELNVLPLNNDSVILTDEGNKTVSLPGDGILISKDYAQKYGIKIGDEINLVLKQPMKKNEKLSARVKGICMMYLSQELYTSFEYLKTLNIEPEVDTLFLTVNDAAGINDVINGLKADHRIKTAISKDETAKKVMNSMKVMDTFIAIMIIASAVLALTVVFNISAINIFERRRDIATLKVLGYYQKEVNSLIFNENMFITAFGSLLGIGFGAAVFYMLIHTMVPEGMMLPYRIKPLPVIIAVVLGFIFTLLANQMLRFRIKRIDMVESLKSVE